MPAPVLQFKRGNAGVAGTVPALRPGEPAISLNNFDFFIGIDTSVANNKFFGSHRYWGREDGTTSLRVKLVDKDGTNSINLKSPNTLAGITTYTLPETPTNGYLLTTNANGDLSWTNSLPGASFSGITTFTNTTDNTLGNADTGAVQIDGGLGVNKNVTVGAGLSVVGQSYFIGTATFYGGQINLGDSDGDNISVAGEFVSNLVPNATNTYDLGLTGKRWRNGYYSGNLDVTGNLIVDGTATIGGGTTVILYGQDVFIKNKDIILGYTTSVTNEDASTDDTANHAGVAIASTVGTPLASFAASGINTLPDTYKQLMWFKQGTLGFGTDAFAFNYGLAIGTTTMATGVRLAVGSGITMSDTSISATTVNATTGNFTNLSGSLTGTISTATRALTVDTTTAPNGTFYPGLFVNNTGTASTAVYVDAGISYVSNTDTLTLTGDIAVNGGDVTTSATTFNLINGTATNVNFGGAATALVMGATTGVGTIRNTTISFPNATTVSSGAASLTLFNTTATNITGFGAATALNLGATTGIATINNPTLVGTQATQNLYNTVATNLNFGGAATALLMGATSGIATIRNTTFSLPNATAVNVNGANPTFSGTSTGTLTFFNANLTSVNAFGAATALNMGATTGIATINNPTLVGTQATQNLYNTVATTMNFAGAATNLVMSAATGVTTVRNKLTVGGNLEVDGNNIQSSTGANVITLSSSNATFANDVTVNGNLYVTGSTTQVNTAALTVEDRTIDLGIVNGAAPAADTTWDLGVLFNYYSSGAAKKSAVVWEHGDSRFKFASVLASDTDGSNNDTPQLTVTTFAPIEIGALWVNDCAGQSQVISCTGTTRYLENITIDAGTF
jgi:hypothetical protein